MLDEIFPLSIKFPKYVRLKNTRLAMLYWSLVLSILFISISAFVVHDGYYLQMSPSGSVQFWPTDWNPSETKKRALNAQDESKDYCKTPEKYEYCDDTDCRGWSALDLQCIDLCTSDSVQDCIEPAERWHKTETSLFFPTYFSEISTTRVGSDQDDVITERRMKKSWQVLKGVEDMGIGFQHDYNIYGPGGFYGTKPVREEGHSRSTESIYGDGLLTILQDKHGNEIARWAPGQTVNLSLKQILQAGHIALDGIETGIGRNFLEGAQIPDGVLMRLAGAEITVELSYHNPASSGAPGWSGPVCYLSIHALPAWTSNPRLQVIDHLGSQRFRYYQGVRIQFKVTGSFVWVSYELIFNKLAQILVFIGSAKKLIFYFSILCLGVVSQVYKGFLFQDAAIGLEACGIAARLASYTATFEKLKDNKMGISEACFYKKFEPVFAKSEELDSGEIKRFVNFVFTRMAKMGNDDADSIDIQDFAHACSYGEALQFRTLIQLFDADRKKTFLERTFAGPTMRKLFKSDKELTLTEEVRAFTRCVTKEFQEIEVALHMVEDSPSRDEQAQVNSEPGKVINGKRANAENKNVEEMFSPNDNLSDAANDLPRQVQYPHDSGYNADPINSYWGYDSGGCTEKEYDIYDKPLCEGLTSCCSATSCSGEPRSHNHDSPRPQQIRQQSSNSSSYSIPRQSYVAETARYSFDRVTLYPIHPMDLPPEAPSSTFI